MIGKARVYISFEVEYINADEDNDIYLQEKALTNIWAEVDTGFLVNNNSWKFIKAEPIPYYQPIEGETTAEEEPINS